MLKIFKLNCKKNINLNSCKIKSLRNKIHINRLRFFIYLFLSSLIFSSANLINRKAFKRNKLNTNRFSFANEPNEKYSAKMKIFDVNSNKDYSFDVILDMSSFYDKSGLNFDTEDKIIINDNFPFLKEDRNGFFLSYEKIGNIDLETINNLIKNRIEIEINYLNMIPQENYKIIIDLESGGFLGLPKNDFDIKTLAKKFISDIKTKKERLLLYMEKFNENHYVNWSRDY